MIHYGVLKVESCEYLCLEIKVTCFIARFTMNSSIVKVPFGKLKWNPCTNIQMSIVDWQYKYIYIF